MKDESIKLLQELIRNECVNPPGNEMKSIQSVANFLESYGVEHEIFESAEDRGNLLATMHGSNNGPSLMYGPSHVDVVPVADPTKWEVPPFSGEIKDGFVWGRGALDMGFIVAAQTVAFAHLHAEGFKPKGDLKLLIVSDEEAGGAYGAFWMLENHQEKVRTDYLVTEFGGFQLQKGYYMFSYGEKGGLPAKLSFKGQEGHGSMPYKADNAVVTMAEAIKRVVEYQTPVTSQYVYAFVKDLPIGGMQKKLVSSDRLLPKAIDMLSKNDIGMAKAFHSLSRMTISPNMCEGGTKINVIPGSATVRLDIRTLPGQDEQYVKDQLKKALGDLAERVEIETHASFGEVPASFGSESEIDSPLVRAMEEVTRDIVGEDIQLIPMLQVAVTDCRFFRDVLGTRAYGWAVCDDALTGTHITSLVHGDNERVTLETVELSVKGYYELAKRFLS